MEKIKLLVMDVDGTLTDGKIYMGQEGELAKAFDIKDGCGIYLVLPKYQIIPVIITARKSKILEKRCNELRITELYQDVKDKQKKLEEIVNKFNVSLDAVAYIGDDLPDISCMEAVKKAGGLVLCPADAVPEIKQLADFVSGCKAGEGAVRDVINYILLCNDEREFSEKHISEVVQLILENDYAKRLPGESFLIAGNTCTIQEYETKDEEYCLLESHRRHIDVQYMISGTERFITYSSKCLTNVGDYDEKKDVELWQNGIITTKSILLPGSLIVVYNGQPHKGAICNGNKCKVRKVVCKIRI